MPPPYLDIVAPQRPWEIEDALKDLHDSFPNLCRRSVLVQKTAKQRTQSYIKIADPTKATNRTAALIVGGIHAREWAPPDALISFARNLLVAYRSGTGIVFPASTVVPLKQKPVKFPEWEIPRETVQFIVANVDLYLFPLANPDGREFDMDNLRFLNSLTNDGWRKNRRLVTPPNAPKAFGVDLNRNFGPNWKFEDYFDMNVYRLREKDKDAPASTEPSHETYRGPSQNSEAETQNITSLIDSLPIRFYVDIHTFGRKVLYAWASEENGDNSSMTFQNLPLTKADGLKAGDPKLPAGRTDYKEYVPDAPPHRIHSRMKTLAEMMRDAILRSAGVDLAAPATPARNHSAYDVGQAPLLYWNKIGPCPGQSSDYAFSRQFIDAARQPIFAYTLEVGHAEEQGFHTSFEPASGHFAKVNREVQAAMTELLTVAAGYAVASTLKPSSLFPCLVPNVQ